MRIRIAAHLLFCAACFHPLWRHSFYLTLIHKKAIHPYNKDVSQNENHIIQEINNVRTNYASNILAISNFGLNPTILFVSFPPLNAIKVGILITP